MTRHITKALRIMATLSLLAATSAMAEPGPDAITLERIGAVRFLQPDEVRQQHPGDLQRDAQPRPSH